MQTRADASLTTNTDAEAAVLRPRRTRLVRLGWLAAVWLGVSVAFAVQISAVGLLPWRSALILSLIDWGPWIVFSPVVVALARRLPIGPKTWKWAVPVHLLASFAVIVAIEAGMSALSLRKEVIIRRHEVRMIERRGDEAPLAPRLPRDPGRFAWLRFVDRARVAVPVYWMLVAGAHAVAQQRRGIERERRALQAEAHLAEARFTALQAQLNPHFLFNTLNTIAQLGYDNPAQAEEMVASLSELLRAVLAAQHRREVSLAEELAFVDRYCAIQKLRFADRLTVRTEVTPNALKAAVPALLLQPLVENAILHGVAPDRAPGTVFVRAQVVADRLHLEVADTGGAAGGAVVDAGRPLHFREGVGLGNTRTRLAALYGDRQIFKLERAVEGGVSVKIELPLRRAEGAA